ncbi:MAG: hypothetical protein CL424_15180 [Acidimicrobiaceae bacterium]|nr:hypothetical protein [Acidimicrobiaceae bacterium]
MPTTFARITDRTRRLRDVLSAMAVIIIVAACGGGDESLVGYQVDPVPHVGTFTVDNTATGEPFTVRAAPGGLLIVFLGFTNCPDVCPTALAEVGQAIDRIGSDADPIDVAMITVDPNRDTPEALTNFVQGFIDRGIGLRTDDAAMLRQLATAFGATYGTEQDHEGDTTDVGHTDQTYLVDDNGDVIVTWTADMTSDDIERDLRLLLDDRQG